MWVNEEVALIIGVGEPHENFFWHPSEAHLLTSADHSFPRLSHFDSSTARTFVLQP